jgi:hypothetical protein
MILADLFLVASPEDVKTLGIVAILVSAIVGALLYPIARAYARRLEGNGSSAALREEVAELAARVESLQQGQERLTELEGRLDFTERMLAQQRDRDPVRLPGQ